ncbi:MAG: sigma-54-dependent Fis family transcriptional regulator [Deltaproteobacteria bacterium]|nr:sigma-54-dependent Fis family transcriptional regulator [Deltaproteobacteria bacterium]
MRVLIADDDASTRYLLELYCRGQSFEPVFAQSGREAISKIREGSVDAVVTDVRMPDVGGDAVLEAARQMTPSLPVLIMTAHGSIDDAVLFLKRGATDYIAKPLSHEVFLHRVNNLLERVSLSRELERLRAQSGKKDDGKVRIIGSSAAMQNIVRRIPMTAQTDATVVIYGESGTGKELIAIRLHEESKRAKKNLVTVNCGALSDALLESELFGYKRGAFTDAHRDTPGLVEEAEDGTLFLDEIGEVSHNVQVKLLRFLQSKEYKALGSPKVKKANVRIIAATNRDLKKMAEKGTFREDLYYRLNIVPVHMPSLRERKGDVPILATHFLRKFNDEYEKDIEGFAPEVFARLVAHEWPGNVRELENKVQQLVVLTHGGMISSLDVLDDNPHDAPFMDHVGTYKEEKRRLLDQFETEFVKRMLERADDNLSEAARLSGLDRKNFWLMAKRHGLREGRRRHGTA